MLYLKHVTIKNILHEFGHTNKTGRTKCFRFPIVFFYKTVRFNVLTLISYELAC